ncbi:heat-inducible transcriptional repressor HrcA [Yeguia hominis]|uniref:Heat-inducible transcription repressor HrcA n=1 Tax=Yeguia hominis TaxID=2763662 RepID=A0A926D976_9FIRM|nr:heat-inducible transcriptional repressor HrcA [Yeguia hominis]MBC8533758.1 heat-inducible transcription repressor HrcA [Yeguia hominis]
MELSERKLKILAAIVSSYIENGEPVGSKSIASDLGVSSATVRNEMADLSELGFLEQPHTSAGRIPSQRGYRLYIDHMMEKKPVTEREKNYMDSALHAGAYDPDRLLLNVSKVLAAITKLAAVSTTPSGNMAVVRAIQFVQTSRRTAMIVLMSSAGTMKTRVFHCDFDLTPEILRIFFRVFNERLAGKPVSSITPAFIQTLGASLGEMMLLMSSALMALLEVANDTLETDVCLDGQVNLLFYPEYGGAKAFAMMQFLERSREVARLLLNQPGEMQVLVGAETGRPELAESGVVIARYAIGGEDAGAIGVIGPMRMDYSKTIANLEYLSHSVGTCLTQLMREESY